MIPTRGDSLVLSQGRGILISWIPFSDGTNISTIFQRRSLVMKSVLHLVKGMFRAAHSHLAGNSRISFAGGSTPSPRLKSVLCFSLACCCADHHRGAGCFPGDWGNVSPSLLQEGGPTGATLSGACRTWFGGQCPAKETRT